MTFQELCASAPIVRVWPEKGVYKTDTDARDRDIALWSAQRMMELVQSGYSPEEAYGVIEEEIDHA